jgi:hypothetical protein
LLSSGENDDKMSDGEYRFTRRPGKAIAEARAIEKDVEKESR